MFRTIVIGVALLTVTSLPAVALGQTAGTTTTRAGADQTFVMQTAAGGIAEVELGKLAADKASNSDVKQFAQRMVTDHSQANEELKALAQKKNITLSTALSPKDQALRERLAKLSGREFDRAYMNAMLQDHRMALNEFRKEAQAGKDPDIKAFAAKTVPTLEDHLKTAQRASQEVVATTGTRPTTRPQPKK